MIKIYLTRSIIKAIINLTLFVFYCIIFIESIFGGHTMNLSDEEIEKKIEKTVYKLEKFYKIYNSVYKIRKNIEKLKEYIFKNFILFLIIYTFILLLLFKSLKGV